MNAAQAIDIGTEWVQGYAAQHPEFRGAHLMGGILLLPRDAPFPETTDLDISILVEDPEQDGARAAEQGVPIDESYREVMIEAGRRSLDLYSSPEVVLASPDLASNLAVDSIVFDPYGLLARIQPVVAAEYVRRSWVTARCEWEKRQAIAALERVGRATTAAEFVPGMVFVLLYLSGLIAVASRRPPTHRKCFVLLRELLQAEGRADLYESTLDVAGCAHLSATQVLAYHELHAAGFDRALEVRRTPVWGDFKLKPHVRPYLVDGGRQAIDRGDHREVMPWLGMGLEISSQVIRNDAPAAESAQYDQVLDDLYQLLGIASAASRSDRLDAAVALKDSLFALADEIVNRLPDDMPTVATTSKN
jgi:hypothetical protein